MVKTSKKSSKQPVLAKEAGWVVSIDQASNAAGCSVWLDGELKAWTVLRSKSAKDSLGARLAAQVEQLDVFLDKTLPEGQEVKTVIFEGVKSNLVTICIGAFCCASRLRNCRIHPRNSFIWSASWKRMRQKQGATGKLGDIKGVLALKETGWDFAKYPIDSDDIADSVHIYECWKMKNV